MAMCVQSIAPCTEGIPHQALKSTITCRILFHLGQRMRSPKMLFSAPTTSRMTTLTVDLPIANFSLQDRMFTPCASL
jgi:hypothetical protein